MVVLELWDDTLKNQETDLLAKKIFQQSNDEAHNEVKFQSIGRFGSGYGKPDILSVNFNTTKLTDIVTPATWRFFSILGI